MMKRPFHRRRCLSLLLILILLATAQTTGMAFSAADPNPDLRPNTLEKVPVLITFLKPPGASEEALIRAFGGSVSATWRLVPGMAAELPLSAVEALRHNPHISVIEPDLQVHIVGDAVPWGISRIGADQVQSAGNTGAGIKVAIIDTGLDYGHPDLAGKYNGGYDFVNKDTNPMDDHGHGTHVAGTIAAVINNQGLVGAAPGVDLYALKVLDAKGSGSSSNIISAVQWCVDNQIQITNNSYGMLSNPGSLFKSAFDNAYNRGVLQIAAAGNDRSALYLRLYSDIVSYPARYDSVVAVAATDSANKVASFSSYGPAVELAAPGVAIESTVPGGGYATWNGTSMATPHVVGAAALVMGSGLSSASAVRTRLQETAFDLGAVGRDRDYGFGLVDAKLATGVVMPPVNTPPVVTITSPASGTTVDTQTPISFSGTATDKENGNLSSSLVWTSSLATEPIGTGAAFSTVLNEGIHTITASVADNDGLTDTAAITVTVKAPAPPGGPIIVSVLEGRAIPVNKNFWKAEAAVTLSPALSGAIITGTWSGGLRVSATTDVFGQCVLSSGNLSQKTVAATTFTITDVTLSGYAYDVNQSKTSVTISKP